MGFLRPSWGKLLQRASKSPHLSNPSVPVVGEQKSGSDTSVNEGSSYRAPNPGSKFRLPKDIVDGSLVVSGYTEGTDYTFDYDTNTFTNRRIPNGTMLSLSYFEEVDSPNVNVPMAVVSSDPEDPEDGSYWYRIDLRELRIFFGGTTFTAGGSSEGSTSIDKPPVPLELSEGVSSHLPQPPSAYQASGVVFLEGTLVADEELPVDRTVFKIPDPSLVPAVPGDLLSLDTSSGTPVPGSIDLAGYFTVKTPIAAGTVFGLGGISYRPDSTRKHLFPSDSLFPSDNLFPSGYGIMFPDEGLFPSEVTYPDG